MKVVIAAALSAALTGCGLVGGGLERSPAAGMHGGMHRGSMEGKTSEKPGAMMGMGEHMRAMDANGDGLLSKAEFLKAHEAMFDRMKKNEQGQVAIASMASMGSMGSMEMCPMMKGR